MWFNKKETKKNEQLYKIIEILNNCHHLVEVSTQQLLNKNINYRFFDMIAGYYWQISLNNNTVTIRTGDVVLIPKNTEELYKMLDIEISKSMIYETQKQSLLLKQKKES